MWFCLLQAWLQCIIALFQEITDRDQMNYFRWVDVVAKNSLEPFRKTLLWRNSYCFVYACYCDNDSNLIGFMEISVQSGLNGMACTVWLSEWPSWP